MVSLEVKNWLQGKDREIAGKGLNNHCQIEQFIAYCNGTRTYSEKKIIFDLPAFLLVSVELFIK